jgi:hypothetical protein
MSETAIAAHFSDNDAMNNGIVNAIYLIIQEGSGSNLRAL